MRFIYEKYHLFDGFKIYEFGSEETRARITYDDVVVGWRTSSGQVVAVGNDSDIFDSIQYVIDDYHDWVKSRIAKNAEKIKGQEALEDRIGKAGVDLAKMKLGI